MKITSMKVMTGCETEGVEGWDMMVQNTKSLYGNKTGSLKSPPMVSPVESTGTANELMGTIITKLLWHELSKMEVTFIIRMNTFETRWNIMSKQEKQASKIEFIERKIKKICVETRKTNQWRKIKNTIKLLKFMWKSSEPDVGIVEHSMFCPVAGAKTLYFHKWHKDLIDKMYIPCCVSIQESKKGESTSPTSF